MSKLRNHITLFCSHDNKQLLVEVLHVISRIIKVEVSVNQPILTDTLIIQEITKTEFNKLTQNYCSPWTGMTKRRVINGRVIRRAKISQS